MYVCVCVCVCMYVYVCVCMYVCVCVEGGSTHLAWHHTSHARNDPLVEPHGALVGHDRLEAVKGASVLLRLGALSCKCRQRMRKKS